MVGFARTPVVLVSLLLFGACVKSQATACGDLLCPEGAVCANETCVSASLATACSGKADGAACTLSELGPGTCQQHLCITGMCGDGKLNGIEACDGADLAGKTCVDFGSTDPVGLACAADCSFDKSGCKGFCGDGIRGTEEQCDVADFGGKTCTDFSPQGAVNKFYAGGAPTCTIDCIVNVSTCTGGWCGDGIKQPAEDCDGTDFGTQPVTCASLGHPGAATPPTCDVATCKFVAEPCSCGLNGICPAATPTCVNTGGTFSCK